MFSKNGTVELQLLFMKLDFLLILCNYYLNIFCAEMDQEWMHLSQTDKRYMHGVSQFIRDAKAHAGNGNPIFCPCKDCKNHRNFRQIESIRSHLITRGFMPNYTIWTMHGEVGVNVLQENDDDVDMPDIAIHDADEEPSVNTEPMAIVNNVFRNTLADKPRITMAFLSCYVM